MPPTHTSLAWIVVGVVPVDGVALLPVALATWSSAPAVNTPAYSITTAAERALV